MTHPFTHSITQSLNHSDTDTLTHSQTKYTDLGCNVISGLELKCPAPALLRKTCQNIHKSLQSTLESSSIQTTELIVKFHTILEMGSHDESAHFILDPGSDFWKCPKKGFKKSYLQSFLEQHVSSEFYRQMCATVTPTALIRARRPALPALS